MKLISILFCLTLLPLSFSTFDFFKLACQWPMSLPVQSNLPTPPRFTVLGLWPSNSSVTVYPPQPCLLPQNRFIPFADPKILNTIWPDVMYGENQVFWSMQWDEHAGCCSLNQSDFFNQAIDLYAEYDILESLVSASIIPSNTQSYYVGRINQTIVKAIKAVPELKCDYLHVNNVYSLVLREVRLCWLPFAKQFFDCPPLPFAPSNLCPYIEYVYIPLK